MQASDASVGGILLRGLGVVRAHPIPLLAPLLLVGLFDGLFSNGLKRAMDRSFRAPATGGLFGGAIFEGLDALENVLFLVLVALAVLFVLVAARAVFMPLLGEGAPSFELAFGAVRPVYVKGLLALVPASLLVTLGFYALLVPGVFLLGLFLTLPAVVVAEGLTLLDAWKRSFAFAKNRYVDLFLLALVPCGIAVVPSLLLGWVPVLGVLAAGLAQGAALASIAVLAPLAYAAYSGLRAPDTPSTTPGTGEIPSDHISPVAPRPEAVTDPALAPPPPSEDATHRT